MLAYITVITEPTKLFRMTIILKDVVIPLTKHLHNSRTELFHR